MKPKTTKKVIGFVSIQHSKSASVKQTFDLLNSCIAPERLYCFQLTVYNGFLNRNETLRFNIKTAEPAAVTETDFREKIDNWAKATKGARAQDWSVTGIKYIGRVGI